jgi:hypothetical protein
MSTARRRIGRHIVVTAAPATTRFGAVLLAPQAFAAGEAVNVYPTTTSDNGAKLQLWSCTGAANQKWNLPA